MPIRAIRPRVDSFKKALAAFFCVVIALMPGLSVVPRAAAEVPLLLNY